VFDPTALFYSEMISFTPLMSIQFQRGFVLINPGSVMICFASAARIVEINGKLRRIGGSGVLLVE
jgi:hypothetical protein